MTCGATGAEDPIGLEDHRIKVPFATRNRRPKRASRCEPELLRLPEQEVGHAPDCAALHPTGGALVQVPEQTLRLALPQLARIGAAHAASGPRAAGP